ncbi:hypothetical protein ACGFWI_04980 [Streptomyces sp. NPDC048434]|uniref:hypothetical protein n=1 Tax=Streptomyces sp. NPDC048434 TaxID=3365549 RepID=UPI003723D5AF
MSDAAGFPPHRRVRVLLLDAIMAGAALSWLSPGERGVLLARVGAGVMSRQVVRRRQFSEQTVRNRFSRLSAALGVQRRIQAAALATQAGSAPGTDTGPQRQ